MTRQQKQRALIVVAALVATAVLGRHLVQRGKILDVRLPSGDRSELSLTAPKLSRGAGTEILRAARGLLEGTAVSELENGGEPGRRLVLLSLSRAKRPALVARGEGESLRQAITAAAAELVGRASRSEIRDGRLKVDVAVARSEPLAFDEAGRARLARGLDGLWLPEADLLLLPEELLSRRLVSTGGELDARRLVDYLAAGGRGPTDFPGDPQEPLDSCYRVTFRSLMEGEDRLPLRLFRGNDRSPGVSPPALLASAVAGGDYLLRHQKEDGNFGYSYEAADDTYDEGYNLLRHAGTCYALAELYRASGDQRYSRAARRGLTALLENAAPPRPEHAAAAFEAIVSPGREAKLGGGALAVLAIVEHAQTSGDHALVPRAERLARFLLFQQEADGHFRSKYFYGLPDPEPFESIYYPGEAILALARLYRLEARDDWLAAARRGADWLIGVRDAGKGIAELPHDHWLLMGLDELHDLTGEARYAAHAARIAQAIVEAQRTEANHLDWIGSFYDPPRSTPTATRAEGLVAMHRLTRRTGADSKPHLNALLRMAAFQRRCQLTAESALYLPRPDRALGGFRRSLTDWEVRIDYVQHNLSAFLGLRSILLEARSVSGSSEKSGQ